MTPVENFFVKPLAEFYGRQPYGPGFAKRLEPYAKDLGPDVLDSVATRLIERGSKTFPGFSVCKDALARAEAAVSGPSSTEPKPWDVQGRDEAIRKAREEAFAMCRCELGEQADREGWLPALIEFVSDRGRLPAPTEERSIIAKARRSEAGLEDARGAPFFGNLVELRRAMLGSAHRHVFVSEALAANIGRR